VQQVTTHGKSSTPEYRVWTYMRQRCTNAKYWAFEYYGGKGIAVCDRWEKFENFIADMGQKPSPEYTIERRDNDKGYEPANCYWATRTQQQRNKAPGKESKTGIVGVRPHTRIAGKYVAWITVKGKSNYLGTFDTIADAAMARKEGEIKYWN